MRVLHADRNSVQRATVRARGDLALGRPRRSHRLVRRDRDERADARVEPVDAIEDRPRQLDRREAPRPQQRSGIEDAQVRQIVV